MQSLKFSVHGVALDFITNSAKLMREIRKDFGHYETDQALKSDGRIRIVETNKTFPLKIPKYAIRETIVLPDSSLFSIHNLRFLEEKEKRILKIDFKKNEVLGYFKSPYKFRETAHVMFLRFLLKWMIIKALEKKGTAFIHGSGVEKDGKSLFFVGPPSFGKTHILIILLLNGYSMITDDNIFFRDGMVRPFNMRSKINADMIKKFPILEKGLRTDACARANKSTYLPELGWLIDLGDIFSIHKKEVQPSKLFYIYIWNAPETKIEAIPKKEMLSRLFHIYRIELINSVWFNQDKDVAMREIFPNYNDFVTKVDCYKVYAGSDPKIFLKTIQRI